jgi:hypothetical protein
VSDLNLSLPGETIIRKVQISAPHGQDALLTRLRVESTLQAAALLPPGLSPSAILVIKRVVDPHLGRLTASRPEYAATQTWARTFELHVAALSKQAARPLFEPVPSDAQAVLFADQAELLACLSLNWLDGSLSAHWWWHSVFPNADFSRLIPSVFVEYALYIPATLEILARIGRVAEFSQALDAPSARAMFAALLCAFDLSFLERSILVPDLPQVAQKKTHIQDDVFDSGGQFIPVHAGLVSQPDNPFSTIAPEVTLISGLSPEVQNLLGVALMLRRAPALLRSKAFAARLAATWRAGGMQPVGVVESSRSGDDSPISTPASQHNIQQVEHQQEPALLREAYLSPTPVVRVTQTNFGGVFYLLNLAVYMEIYDDFTRPANSGWDLQPWDLLAMLGRHWLGEAFEADPLWTLLAQLAGRDPSNSPGADFMPPPDWEMPFLRFGLPAAPADLSWLEQLAHHLRVRLELALGFDDPLRLLDQPAQVFISSTRLDVYFSLATHPLEVRLAGLDRDLGWLPAAGYAIFYQFE